MKYIIELNHPKHYYQFKYIRKNLLDEGHQVWVLARDKDVLLNVLEEENVDYIIFGKHRKSLFAKILGTLSILVSYISIFFKLKPDVVISKASFYGTFVARLFFKKAIIFPDSEVVKLTNKIVAPMSNLVVTPETFGLDYGKKHIKVPGFFENCYLCPTVFTPDSSIIDKYGLKQPYAVFRFVGWYANHDVGNNGFTLEEKISFVKEVEKNMTVYISSEKELPEELKKYKLPTPAAQIHSVLSYADLYLGDSQTMATESALLGTPAIRSNSFVGPNDMTNFIVLEKKYGLLKNIASYNDVLNTLIDFSKNSRKAEWINKLVEYNNSVGDTNTLITDIIKRL